MYFASLVIFIFKIRTSHFVVLCQTMKNPWKATCVGTHLECSAEFWSLCSRWVLAFVRNQPAESFHFLMPDGFSPNLCKHQNLQVWHFYFRFFTGWPWWKWHGRWSSSCCGRQGKSLLHVHMSHFGPFLIALFVCDFRKSSRLARPDGARTRSNSSRFCVWGTGNIFFEVSATHSHDGTSSLNQPARMRMNADISSSFSVWRVSKDFRKRHRGQH